MKYNACAVAISALFLTSIVPAHAQEFPGGTALGRSPMNVPGVSVFDRDRPEFEAEGFTAGDFIVVPSVTVGGYYDSNIFADDTDEVGSFVAFVGPRIEARSERPNLSLRATVTAGISRYERDSQQNAEEFSAGGRVRYKFSALDTGTAGLEFRRVVVNRSDEDEGGGTGDPRLVHRIIGRAGYETSFDAITVDARLRAVDHDFQLSEQRDNDRRTYDGSVQLGYRTSRVLTAFVEPHFEVLDFDTAVDDNGFARDAERYGARAGLIYELGDRLSAEGSIGVARWEFDDARFDSEDIWTADGSVGWNVTPLTSLKARGSRDETHTTRAGSSLREVITVGVGAEHEFRPDIITFVDAEYRVVDFNRDSREDDNTAFSVGGRYYLSKMFSFTGKYVRTERDSNVDTEDFTRDFVWLSVDAQF